MKIAPSNTSFRANKMTPMQAKIINDKLMQAKNVDIICHDATDKDCANSAITMWDYLNSKGVNSRIIISGEIDSLKLRENNCHFIQADDFNEKIPQDVVLCVDFSSKARVKPKIMNFIRQTYNLMGLDHHSEPDITRHLAYQNSPKTLHELKYVPMCPFYVDASAKSATSVIYRFFEALGKEIDEIQGYDLLTGLADDCSKRDLIKCDGKKGTIEAKKELIKDKNAYEIFIKLMNKLSDEQIAEIAQKIDILANLTDEEIEFKNSLQKNMKLSKNGNIAYIEIPSNDKTWQKLGGDNIRTSAILRDFRKNTLQDENLDKIKAVFTFYNAGDVYRISAHTKDDSLLNFFSYVGAKRIPNFEKNSGGHPARGGGRISTTDEKQCHNWVRAIVSCEDFYDNY